MPQQIKFRATQTVGAVEALASQCDLPKARIKDAMQKGACFIRKGSKTTRLRRAKATLKPGQTILLNYDQQILSTVPIQPNLLQNFNDYSLWYKPAGLLSQGSEFGDHCALTRLAEIQLQHPIFLVQRLDREAAGLMLLAHNKNAAAAFSKLFQNHDIEKCYQITVLGKPNQTGRIVTPLDGKQALTEYEVISYNADSNTAQLQVIIQSGRLHQIRRHFASIGHPVMGDPRYGKNNQDRRGLQLVAVSLKFKCPLTGKMRSFRLDSYRLDEKNE